MASGGGPGKTSKATGEPGWKWRRTAIFPVVIFACWRLAEMENAPDTAVNETIAWGWMLLISVLILGYTGFATVQDIVAIWATKSGRPYQQQMQPSEPDRVGDSIPAPEDQKDADNPPDGFAG